MKKELHPLRVWVNRRKISLPQFAVMSGIKQRTLYDSIEGERDPKLSTLQAISDATDGAVTVARQAAWFRGRAK